MATAICKTPLRSLPNVVVSGKGYVEKETSLALLELESGTFQGSLSSPLKSGGFLWHF